ncbi:MAG: LamG-like jellyroll fold domain-containing protein, partial [Phycisphaerales bacterium]
VATASGSSKANMGPEKTVDGSGLNNLDQHDTDSTHSWLSGKGDSAWIQFTFDGVYKLDKALVWNCNQALESLLGVSAKDVKVEYSADGETWTLLGDFVFPQAPGTEDYVADTVLEFAGVAAKAVKFTITSNWGDLLDQYGLSEVRFYNIPVTAREPSPADDANDVNPQVLLSWRAGREADSHKVYVSEDEQAVAEGTAPVVTVNSPEYEASLLLDSTYYWKVTEVNDVEAISAWDGKVWTFDTAHFVAVDDFESYLDDQTTGKAIFQAWIDGYEDDNNGSLVGYIDPPFAEQTIVSSGKQSMPLAYENTGSVAYSEATLSFDPAQDWTQHGFTTLVLSFRGQSANDAASLYLKINDKKLSFNNGAAATAIPIWKQWILPLAGTGASLQNVKSLTIGVEGSGTGMLFIDDIRLYAVAPEAVTPADPGTTGLVALYTMDGNVQDSSGKKYDGTLNGDASYEDGYAGQALVFNAVNAYVDLPIGSMIATLTDATIAAHVNFGGGTGGWQRVFDFGTDTTVYMFLSPRQGTGGGMRFAIRTATVAEQAVDGPRVPVGWHHMAIAIDSNTMTLNLYLDGVLVASAATTLLPKDLGNTTQNWLGRSQWTADAYFLGSLDDFRIYNRVLSEAEVRYLAGDR